MSEVVENAVDISTELRTIAEDKLGSHVKQAIYDALVKVNNAKIPSPPVENASIPDNVVLQTNFYQTAPTISAPECVEYMPDGKWIYVQETNDNEKTSASVTVQAPAHGLLVAAVMSRSTPSISGDGWTKVVDGEVNNDQRITVWSKPITSGTYTVQTSQSSNVRMSLKVFVLCGAASVTSVENKTMWFVVGASSYAPVTASGKRRLYLMSSFYGSNDGITPVFAAVDYSGLDLREANELRFAAFYDYQPELEITPHFTIDGGSGMSVCTIVTLDINEEE